MKTCDASLHTAEARRRICSWCGDILGPLLYPSLHHSYTICAECAQRYFEPLYAPIPTNAALQPLRERAIGET